MVYLGGRAWCSRTKLNYQMKTIVALVVNI
jgi:hypothetical protein